ncbi:MAG TPA: hypothetical protein VIG39_03055 [Rhizomicrobium sp.]|jgi:hypothetical protein
MENILSMAGLEPAIQQARGSAPKKELVALDGRVKPAHGEVRQ